MQNLLYFLLVAQFVNRMLNGLKEKRLLDVPVD
ncbi:Uncharacterised protein [Vibrio cholerae]|nr:Uncharacterised protein [Vibrio cholerae]CSI35951.1 Uncharacterised protein [Vibrio cholerae]